MPEPTVQARPVAQAAHASKGDAGSGLCATAEDLTPAQAQAAELNAWAAAKGEDGAQVPGCLESERGGPGAASRTHHGPVIELRLWNFDTGSDLLKPAHLGAIAALRAEGNLHGADVSLVGQASPVGEAEGNRALATARAESVKAALPAQARVDSVVGAAGVGTTENSARDRAVVLLVRPATNLKSEDPSSGHRTEAYDEAAATADLDGLVARLNLPFKADVLAGGFVRPPQPPVPIMARLLETNSFYMNCHKWAMEFAVGAGAAAALSPMVGGGLASRGAAAVGLATKGTASSAVAARGVAAVGREAAANGAQLVADRVTAVVEDAPATDSDAIAARIWNQTWREITSGLARYGMGFDREYRILDGKGRLVDDRWAKAMGFSGGPPQFTCTGNAQ